MVRAHCRHAKKTIYQCSQVTDADLLHFNAKFNSHETKIDQDNMIMKFIEVAAKKTVRRKQNPPAQMQRQRSSCETSFFLMRQTKEKVRVCKDFFLKALGLGRTRVENIAKHCYSGSGSLRCEKRGGDRKEEKFRGKKQTVRKFLKQLMGRECHKTRKMYLPSDITSVKQLWRLYQEQHANEVVKYEYFRRIFRREFRIGFCSPKTDACSMCERLTNQMKMELDPVKKQALYD